MTTAIERTAMKNGQFCPQVLWVSDAVTQLLSCPKLPSLPFNPLPAQGIPSDPVSILPFDNLWDW
jgi:hypothetical protein